MKIYKSCSTLSIYSFFKIIETLDYKYLIYDYDDENDNIKLSKKDEVGLANIFKNIVYEYSEKSGDTKLKTLFKKKILLIRAELEYAIASEILNLFIEYNDTESLKMLNIIGFKIDLNNKLKEQIESIVLKLKRLKNKIALSKLVLNKKNKVEDKKQHLSLYKQAIILERNLDLKYSIDIKNVCILKWISLINISKNQ